MLMLIMIKCRSRSKQQQQQQQQHILLSKRLIQRCNELLLLLLVCCTTHCNALQSILNGLIEIKSLSSSSLITNLVGTDDDDFIHNQQQSSSHVNGKSSSGILQETNLLSTILSPFPKLHYPISKKGISSFRSLLRDDDDDTSESDKDENNQHNVPQGKKLVQQLWLNCSDPIILNLSNSIKSLIMLCNGYNDLAHEIVLGINPTTNIEEAEYVAAPSSTVDKTQAKIDFITRHPLSNSDDIVHSLIHRYCEGTTIGEGGYTGYQNSKYWIAGGPKQLYNSNNNNNNNNNHQHQHPIYSKLAQFAIQHCPLCVSTGVVLIDDDDDNNTTGNDNNNHEKAAVVTHTIIAGGGKRRTAVVNGVVVLNSRERTPTNSSSNTTNYIWDPFRFIDLFEIMTTEAPQHSIMDEKVKVKSVKNSNGEEVEQSKDGEEESSHIDDKLVSLVQSLDKETLRNELILLQQIEICLLIQYELEQQT